MRLRLARAQGLALAGVAAAAVLAGGLFFSEAGARPSVVVARSPVLARPTPHWHDGYNHFIVTISGPAKATVRLSAAARSSSRARGAPGDAAVVSARSHPSLGAPV